MPEPQPLETTPKELSFTPVDKDVIDGIIKKIPEDPEDFYKTQGAYLMFSDEGIHEIFQERLLNIENASHTDFNAYDEGIIFTWAVLYDQAEKRGLKLPKVRREAVGAFFKDKPLAIIEDLDQDFVARESSLAEGLKEVTKYRPTRKDFYTGAMDIYNFYQNIEQSRNLENQLKF